jgi:hypothetical protein
MRTRIALPAFLLLIGATNAGAFTLDELRRSLAEFHGDSPMRVRVDAVHRRNAGKETKESRTASVVEDDGTSLRIVHDKKELRKHQTGAKRQRSDDDVTAGGALDLMNYAPRLLELLEGATLKRAVPSSLDGAPATLVEFVPVREKDEDGDKWIKNYEDLVTVWLGPGNVPIAAERNTAIKVRVVVIGAEFSNKEKYRFARNGDRLVVASHAADSASSGLGRSEKQWMSETVTVLK